mgnify:FL=1
MKRIQLTDSNKLMVVCGHALEQIKVGFPVHTMRVPPAFREDSGKVVLCDLCFEKGQGGNWQQISASSICEHCFAQTAIEMKQQRKVN